MPWPSDKKSCTKPTQEIWEAIHIWEEIQPSDDVAKKAMVIMAFGSQTKGKAPIAFFFMKGLAAAEQTALLKMVINRIVEIGIIVHAVGVVAVVVNHGFTSLFGTKGLLSDIIIR